MVKEHDHIVSKFDEDLNQLDNLIAEMGGLAEHQFADAIKALVKRDGELAEKVILSDKRIDAIEENVDQHTISMLALRQPMADDLRVVITALRIASVIERIGDYSKNIAKASKQIGPNRKQFEPLTLLPAMAEVAAEMVHDVLTAYAARDAELAREVIATDEKVDAFYNSIFRNLVSHMVENPSTISSAAQMLFIARNLERVGDHATNVAEMVHFAATGNYPPDEDS